MIVRNDECVSWDALTVLGLFPQEYENVEEMLIRQAKSIAEAPDVTCAEVVFYERSYTVNLAWLTKE